MPATLRRPDRTGNVDPFAHRAGDYAAANKDRPDARRAERDRLLAPLPLAEMHRVIDLQAASGYVGRGVTERTDARVRVASVEPSRELVRRIPADLRPVHAELHALPFESASVDAVLCLAGTHHSDRLQGILAESRRVLAPAGWLSIAEAEIDSGPARWLNGFVDRWNRDGHRGRFVAPGELADRLATAGFEAVSESVENVPWHFSDRISLHEFCRTLFGLRDAPMDALVDELAETVGIDEGPGGVELRWTLRYAIARRPRHE